MRSSRIMAGALVSSALLGAALAPAALADGPERVVGEVHISTAFPAGTRCPFEVVRTVDGTLTTTTWTDADGLTRVTDRFSPGSSGT